MPDARPYTYARRFAYIRFFGGAFDTVHPATGRHVRATVDDGPVTASQGVDPTQQAVRPPVSSRLLLIVRLVSYVARTSNCRRLVHPARLVRPVSFVRLVRLIYLSPPHRPSPGPSAAAVSSVSASSRAAVSSVSRSVSRPSRLVVRLPVRHRRLVSSVSSSRLVRLVRSPVFLARPSPRPSLLARPSPGPSPGPSRRAAGRWRCVNKSPRRGYLSIPQRTPSAQRDREPAGGGQPPTERVFSPQHLPRLLSIDPRTPLAS